VWLTFYFIIILESKLESKIGSMQIDKW
jgi:hypothetical protein